MYKNSQKHIRSIISIVVVFIVSTIIVATAYAAVSLIAPQEAIKSGHMIEKLPELTDYAQSAKSRAPEPSTMVLFGGGFLGMIVSFIRRTYAAAKRIFDFTAAMTGFIILSPLFLMTAVMVKLTSKGPILYKQVRVGQFGKEFEIYKFRSMKVDAEKETGPVWAQANDNRLTPIGKFLRKSHIDEIPQLINVVKGEMSIIGPRPERPVFVEQFKREITGYEQRLEVKPGITGLAQVWHRYDETIQDVKKKLRYDLLYIRKMCFWADINIILRTFRVVVTGEGAR
ncbi:MAG: exopolysaccharide biosynthesis polyprenyl glycosylphosphotransferase [Candidatus Omnitrophica bacterium]|nr:exopolysaccharide biosynthesis polyprenyl glycosylphosphotransferase [Candidatus Omnitrophota bacterium]